MSCLLTALFFAAKSQPGSVAAPDEELVSNNIAAGRRTWQSSVYSFVGESVGLRNSISYRDIPGGRKLLVTNLIAIAENLKIVDLKDRKSVKRGLDAIRINLNGRDAEKVPPPEEEMNEVLAGMQQLAERVEAEGEVPSPENYDYQCPMERLVYTYRFANGKYVKHRHPDFPYVFFYDTWALLLMISKQYDKARTVMEKGLVWDPFYTPMLTMYINASQKLKDWEAYHRTALDMLAVSYRRHDVGEAFIALGGYYLQREQFKECYSCMRTSKAIDPEHWKLEKQLFQVRELCLEKAENISDKNVGPILESCDIHFPDIIKTAQAAAYVGELSYNDGYFQQAMYYLKEAYHVTQDEHVKNLLDSMQGDPTKMN